MRTAARRGLGAGRALQRVAPARRLRGGAGGGKTGRGVEGTLGSARERLTVAMPGAVHPHRQEIRQGVVVEAGDEELGLGRVALGSGRQVEVHGPLAPPRDALLGRRQPGAQGRTQRGGVQTLPLPGGEGRQQRVPVVEPAQPDRGGGGDGGEDRPMGPDLREQRLAGRPGDLVLEGPPLQLGATGERAVQDDFAEEHPLCSNRAGGRARAQLRAGGVVEGQLVVEVSARATSRPDPALPPPDPGGQGGVDAAPATLIRDRVRPRVGDVLEFNGVSRLVLHLADPPPNGHLDRIEHRGRQGGRLDLLGQEAAEGPGPLRRSAGREAAVGGGQPVRRADPHVVAGSVPKEAGRIRGRPIERVAARGA